MKLFRLLELVAVNSNTAKSLAIPIQWSLCTDEPKKPDHTHWYYFRIYSKKMTLKHRLGVINLPRVSTEQFRLCEAALRRPNVAEDHIYYAEMALNREYIQRVKMANEYKASASAYIWEALSLYLESKQEAELEGTLTFPHHIRLMTNLYDCN
jgi:hypothetical protein